MKISIQKYKKRTTNALHAGCPFFNDNPTFAEKHEVKFVYRGMYKLPQAFKWFVVTKRPYLIAASCRYAPTLRQIQLHY